MTDLVCLQLAAASGCSRAPAGRAC